jgi:DNA polymerase-3 subunit epsilon
MLTSLTRPLVFLDFETTTNVVKDARIVQYNMRKFHPSGDSEAIGNYVNPVVPITEAATNIHGITNEQVAGFPTFTVYGTEVYKFIKGCDLVTYNGNVFDIPVLYNEFCRVGIDWDYSDVHFIDACNIFKINEPRDLAHAYKHYTGRTLIGEHNASKDVDATIDVFVHQMEKYSLPWNMEQLALYSNYGQKRADLTGKFTVDAEGNYIINFGAKCKGQKATDNKTYLAWMLSQDFPEDAKRICRKILNVELV